MRSTTLQFSLSTVAKSTKLIDKCLQALEQMQRRETLASYEDVVLVAPLILSECRLKLRSTHLRRWFFQRYNTIRSSTTGNTREYFEFRICSTRRTLGFALVLSCSVSYDLKRRLLFLCRFVSLDFVTSQHSLSSILVNSCQYLTWIVFDARNLTEYTLCV